MVVPPVSLGCVYQLLWSTFTRHSFLLYYKFDLEIFFFSFEVFNPYAP